MVNELIFFQNVKKDNTFQLKDNNVNDAGWEKYYPCIALIWISKITTV